MINCSRLRELLSNYDPNAHEDDVVKSDEQRAKLLTRFPKEDWPTMTLERYALGQPDQPDNFCRWMEFVTSTIGSIRGGSARKHLIYFQASTGEWWFDHKLYSNVEQAWEAVRSGFVRAIELAEAGAWDQVDQIPSLRGAPALVNKTLAVYFPNELLPINSETHLRHFLRELGDPRADDQTRRTVGLNRLLLDGIRTCGTLESWSTKQMERLLYSSDLDPFIAQLPSSPIKDVPGFIKQLLTDWGDERLEARRESEDQARRLLDEFAGEMNDDQARTLFSLFNADRLHGRVRHDRFSPAFVGQTANALINDLPTSTAGHADFGKIATKSGTVRSPSCSQTGSCYRPLGPRIHRCWHICANRKPRRFGCR